jgi:hypothetical protein
VGAFIDSSGGRGKCAVCGRAIAKGEARIVVDTYSRGIDHSTRERLYYDVPCAVERDRQLVAAALVARDSAPHVESVLDVVARLDAALAAEVGAQLAGRVVPPVERVVTPLDDAQTRALIEQLEARPGDRGVLAVLADHLQQRGDERGELIVLDLEASTDPAQLARRRHLVRVLAPDLSWGEATWGIGFLRTLKLGARASLAERASLLQHPACRLLETLHVHSTGVEHTKLAIPGGLVPRSVRALHVSAVLASDPSISELVHLERLQLADCDAIAHPSVRSLVLSHSSESTIAACARGLPAVTSLELWGSPEVIVLEKAGLLGRVHELILHGWLTGDDIARIERALAGRRLAKLAVHDSGLGTNMRSRLHALADVLVFPDARPAQPGVAWVEHSAKPEWGRGKIVREADGKIEVAFASGKRTFKADAPFLRRVEE